jgi:hypothetical protein
MTIACSNGFPDRDLLAPGNLAGLCPTGTA